MAEDAPTDPRKALAPRATESVAAVSGPAEPLVADVGFIAGRLVRNSLKPFARKKCDHCRSKIPVDATVCRYCSRDT